MPCIKQKTVSVGNQKQTVALKKKRNTYDDNRGKNMYVIEDKDTGELIEDPYFDKQRAKQAFDRTISDIERGMQSARDDNNRGGGPLPW